MATKTTGQAANNNSTESDAVATPTADEEEALQQAAFDEFATADDVSRASSTPPPEEEPEDDEPTDGDDPEQNPAAAKAGDGDDATGGSPAGEPAPDVWQGATEAQRAAYSELQRQAAKAEHAFNSNRHRLSAFQRKINALESELEKAKKTSSPASGAESGNAGTGSGEPAPSVAKTPDGDVDLKQFAEDFPEVYAAVRHLNSSELDAVKSDFQKRLDAMQERLESVSEPVNEIANDREYQYKQNQLAALAQVHPDYQEIQSNDGFWQWVDSQTPAVKALVGSTSAEDNIALLNLFKANQPRAEQPAPQQGAARTPHRPRSADAGESLPRSGSTRPTAMPENEDAAWDYFAKQADGG